jgi:hypothetical protein
MTPAARKTLLGFSFFTGEILKERPLKDAQFCFSSRRAKISPIGGTSRLFDSFWWVVTGGIHRVFRGLKFESNAVMEQKGVFFKGLKESSA